MRYIPFAAVCLLALTACGGGKNAANSTPTPPIPKPKIEKSNIPLSPKGITRISEAPTLLHSDTVLEIAIRANQHYADEELHAVLLCKATQISYKVNRGWNMIGISSISQGGHQQAHAFIKYLEVPPTAPDPESTNFTKRDWCNKLPPSAQ